MTNIARVRVTWQNFPGAPGVSTFYTDPVSMQAKVDALSTFFGAIKGQFPTLTTFTVAQAGDVINDADGLLQSSWVAATTPALQTATGVGSYSGTAGGVVTWNTATVADGKRLRGRTFLVPLIGSAFGTNGAMTGTAQSTIFNAAQALITAMAGGMLVWHRPVHDKTTGAITRPGSSGPVTSTTVSPISAALRTRRV